VQWHVLDSCCQRSSQPPNSLILSTRFIVGLRK